MSEPCNWLSSRASRRLDVMMGWLKVIAVIEVIIVYALVYWVIETKISKMGK